MSNQMSARQEILWHNSNILNELLNVQCDPLPIERFVILHLKKGISYSNLIHTTTISNRALGGILKVGGPTLAKFLKKKI